MAIEYKLEQDDLAACPFCGSIDQDTSSNGYENHFVVCNNCGAEGPSRTSEEDAITAWFTRSHVLDSQAIKNDNA